MRGVAFLFIGLFWVSCNNPYGDENALATYENRALYFSDIASSFPKQLAKEDSIKFLSKIVDNWLGKQLLYDKAMQHGTHNKLNVDKQVENYRQEIIIHKYKSELFAEKIDTAVSMAQLEKYYERHKSEFFLRENIFTYYYVKLPKSVPDSYRLNNWLRNVRTPEQLIEIKEFSYQNARLYEFDDKWVNIEKIRTLLPEDIDDESRFLEVNTIYTQRDDLYLYFIKVTGSMQKGEIAPINYVKNKIKQIVKSKRKVDFINQFENSLINEAKNNRNVKINI